MAQQTAVDWLIMQLPVKIRVELYEQNIHEQAKQMQKEQSKRDYYAGLEGYIVKDGGFEQYYKETYGNNQNK